jgi:LytS/YehU family sensor histidine kinase
MIRNILESTREEYVMLQTEIELIHDYLELQKLRHDNKFDFLIEVDDAIDPEVIQVPPMLTQPFIENAVEHGIRQKKGQGRIEIRFFMTGSTLHFMVQDDGIGREAAGRTGSNKGKLHRAMSSQITLERLQILNRKQRPEVLIHITDLFDDEGNPAGTRVEFEMPITG